MIVVIQRVTRASVRVDGEETASIGPGLLLLVAVVRGDDRAAAERAAEKISNLRIFPVERGVDDRMNLSIRETGGSVLVVSQFTLAGSLQRGRRPSFDRAAAPGIAEPLYLHFAEALADRGVPVARGVFRAMMEVELVNDGPVTLILDTRE